MSQTYHKEQEPCKVAKLSIVRLLLALISSLMIFCLSACRTKHSSIEHYQESLQEKTNKRVYQSLELDAKVWEELSIEELSLCLDSLSPLQVKLVKRQLIRQHKKEQKAKLDSLTTTAKQRTTQRFQSKKKQSQGLPLTYCLALLLFMITLPLWLRIYQQKQQRK